MLSKAENDEICRTGPGTTMGEFFRRFWLPTLVSSELPAPDCPPIRLTLLSEKLVCFRDSAGAVGVLAENCPHRGASLFFGRNEESGLRCVYHGWKFDVTGQCIDMPSEPPESVFKAKVRATAYRAIEHAGIIWIYMGPQELNPELPQFEWARLPSENRQIGKYVVEANYLQVIEGSIDTVHVGFLHRGPRSLAHRAELETANPGGASQRPLNDFTDINPPNFFATPTEYGVRVMARRFLPDDRANWRVTQVFLPSYAMLPGGGDSGSVLGTVPIDDENCFCWRWSWNTKTTWSEEQIANMSTGAAVGGVSYPELIPGTFKTTTSRSNDYLIDRDLQRNLNFTGIQGDRAADQAVTESMGPIKDRTREHLATTDIGIITTRRRLLHAARDLHSGVEPRAANNGMLYHVRSAAVTLPRDARFEDDEMARVALLATV